MNQELFNNSVTKYECHYKDDVQDFSYMIDRMIEKYSENKEVVYDSIGITEKDVNKAKFNIKQFRNALDFYLRNSI